jgi:hypothetical protein|tara:strand:- start:17899 stop:18186 length:288 start_codon:yes stop_codon:yes gene_type:complete
MFNVNVSQLGSVVVKTSEQGGLNNEQIADLAVEKIASVSENAPPHLKQQAKLFKEQLKGIIHHYLLLARKEERATIMQALRSSGHKEMAEYIRRL